MSIGSIFWSVVLMSTASQAYLSPEALEEDKSTYKAVIFLSQKCPCSKGHVEHLNELARKHSEVKFYGVISEPVTLKNKTAVESYFTRERFAFPIVRDDEQKLVKKYAALKTPHVTFFNEGEITYQGGVTNKKSFKASSSKFLEVNLNLLASGKDFKFKSGSSLGCYIRRY